MSDNTFKFSKKEFEDKCAELKRVNLSRSFLGELSFPTSNSESVKEMIDVYSELIKLLREYEEAVRLTTDSIISMGAYIEETDKNLEQSIQQVIQTVSEITDH